MLYSMIVGIVTAVDTFTEAEMVIAVDTFTKAGMVTAVDTFTLSENGYSSGCVYFKWEWSQQWIHLSKWNWS